MKEFIVGKNDSNQRLDKFLMKLCPSLPSSMLYKSLRKDCVKINNKHIKDASFRLNEGDVIKLFIKDEFFEAKREDFTFIDLKPDINIVYEDENILLIDKKAGITVHEDDEKSGEYLIDHIKAYLYQKGEYKPEEENTFVPSLCNRLDRNTAGIIIAAKNAETLRIINQKIKDRELTKKYLCIAIGIFEKKEDTLKDFLFKDEKEKRVYVYKTSKKGSKTIITKYKVLAENDGLSLVEAELLTGRTHQIRAHLASINHALLGDGKYGINKINKHYNITTQALYSYKLRFDFTTDAGILSYLDKKEFTVNPFDDKNSYWNKLFS